jgi:MYXO-CTERM domain-containing protein
MYPRSLALGLPLLVVTTGCSGGAVEGAGAEPVASSNQAIMGGHTDTGDADVVDVLWNMGGTFSECSGSLLAPNMVLTAHHCVSNLLNGAQGVNCAATSFAAPDSVANFFVSTKAQISMNVGDYHMVSEIVVAPPAGTSKICGVDQAIIILADNVAPAEAVPLVPRVDVAVTTGETYSAVGFGVTSDTGNDSGLRRRLDGLSVDCTGAACTQVAGNQIDTAHEFIGATGTCEGDSGGPALDTLGRVFGVTSRGGVACSTPIYGDVYSWGDWIKQTAQHAATVGGYAPPSWVTGWPTDPAFSQPIMPIDGACGGAATCPSNICLEDSAGSYCTRLCEDAAPCPDGSTCETVDNVQLCQRTPSIAKSGCSVPAADPTEPVPWLLPGLGALALLRRARRRTMGGARCPEGGPSRDEGRR